MAGRTDEFNSTDGKLSVLDLSKAKIVEGGDSYYCYLGHYYYTSNDVIGRSAFDDCSGLTSLTLPADITSIGDEAFQGCSGLTSIYVYAEKVPKIDSNAFKGVDAKKCTVYVPMGTRDDYCASDFGDYFENIVEFEATGIDKTTTSTDVEEVVRYSVNGQRLSAPTKGLNIVKYSYGSVKKVAVR